MFCSPGRLVYAIVSPDVVLDKLLLSILVGMIYEKTIIGRNSNLAPVLKTAKVVFNIKTVMIGVTACSYHVTYAFLSESTHCLNVMELFA